MRLGLKSSDPFFHYIYFSLQNTTSNDIILLSTFVKASQNCLLSHKIEAVSWLHYTHKHLVSTTDDELKQWIDVWSAHRKRTIYVRGDVWNYMIFFEMFQIAFDFRTHNEKEYISATRCLNNDTDDMFQYYFKTSKYNNREFTSLGVIRHKKSHSSSNI